MSAINESSTNYLEPHKANLVMNPPQSPAIQKEESDPPHSTEETDLAWTVASYARSFFYFLLVTIPMTCCWLLKQVILLPISLGFRIMKLATLPFWVSTVWEYETKLKELKLCKHRNQELEQNCLEMGNKLNKAADSAKLSENREKALLNEIKQLRSDSRVLLARILSHDANLMLESRYLKSLNANKKLGEDLDTDCLESQKLIDAADAS